MDQRRAAGTCAVQTGDPQELTQQLRGRIWRKAVDKTDVGAYQASWNVISTRRVAGRTLLHVYAESQPDASFVPAEADLEDLYFFAMRARGQAA